MFTAYFDASGSENDSRTPYLVVAGYLSTAEKWTVFSDLWTKRLQKDGLTYFRMSEYAHSIKEFEGWRPDEDRRRRLLNDLIGLVKSYVVGMFGCVVKISAMQAMTNEARDRFHLTAYVLAGRNCAGEVAKWIHESAQGGEAPPCELIYEDGDTGQSALTKRLTEDEYPFSFKPKRDTMRKSGLIEPGFVPLQAADILAYEIAAGVRRGNFKRWPAVQLESIPGRIGIFEEEDMPELESRLRNLG